MKGKKGVVMRSFIVGLLLAFILFIPIAMVASKAFGGTKQGEENFYKLAFFLEEYAKTGKEGSK